MSKQVYLINNPDVKVKYFSPLLKRVKNDFLTTEEFPETVHIQIVQESKALNTTLRKYPKVIRKTPPI